MIGIAPTIITTQKNISPNEQIPKWVFLQSDIYVCNQQRRCSRVIVPIPFPIAIAHSSSTQESSYNKL
jgi:hypothetical protein